MHTAAQHVTQDHPASPVIDAQAPAIHPSDPATESLKATILANRGATYPEEYNPKNLISPVKLTDGVKAASRIATALLNSERIVCVADFDCDGATSAAILIRGLTRFTDTLRQTMGIRPATLEHVIPDRFKYGYGLKPRLAEDKIKPLNPDVIITLDNGISSHDAVDLIATWTGVSASSLSHDGTGAPDVIITDHHAQGDTLPKAYAVVNPNRKDCPFPSKALAGCGVAFYMVMLVRQALISRLNQQGAQSTSRNPNANTAIAHIGKLQVAHLSDLVTVGTVGDLVPLDANNRLLVKVGLDRINKGWQMPPRKAHMEGYLSFGVRALLESANVQYPITTTDLAFQVCPRINAVGRLEEPVAGVACLLADTQMMAGIEAKTCHRLNEERKGIQKEMQVTADEKLAALSFDPADTVAQLLKEQPRNDAEAPGMSERSAPDPLAAVVLYDDDWHPGIVGLIASRIKEQTKGAVICLSPEQDPNEKPDSQQASGDQPATGDQQATGDPDWLKGSGRSDNVNIRDAVAYVVARAPDMLIQFGGHSRAMGCSVHRSELRRFTRLFKEAVQHLLSVAPLDNPVFRDGRLPPELRTHRFAAWCERQPWGQLFPEPTFTQNFKVLRTQPMGTEHQRVVLMDADEQPLVIAGSPDTAPGESNPLPVYGTASNADSINMVWFFSRNQRESRIVTPDHLLGAMDRFVSEDGTLQPGATVRVTYQFLINRFRGENTLQGIIRGIELLGGSR